MAVHAKDVRAEMVAGRTPVQRFNTSVGERVTSVLGSMWFFWFCVCLDAFAFIGLVLATGATWRNGGLFAVGLLWVVFISQTVIQLLALPVLQFSGNEASIKADARAEATFRNASDAEKNILKVLAHLDDQDREILKIVKAVDALEAVRGGEQSG